MLELSDPGKNSNWFPEKHFKFLNVGLMHVSRTNNIKIDKKYSDGYKEKK